MPVSPANPAERNALYKNSEKNSLRHHFGDIEQLPKEAEQDCDRLQVQPELQLISGYLDALKRNGLLDEVKSEDITMFKCTQKGFSVASELNHARYLVSFMYLEIDA